VTGESEKPDALARVLRRPRADAPLVVTRSAARARHAAGEMRARGFIIGEARGPGIDAILSPSAEAERPLIAYDVPFDAQSLAGMDLDDGLVLVEPRELAHLHSIASEAGITVKAVGGRQPRGATAAFLEEIRSAIGEQDIDAQLALIDPLFDEHSAAEVAAALCALLRARRTAGAGSAAREEPTDRPMAFVRLFVSAGQRDNIRPADLVGAITGEASITGDQIGKIDMRDTFSVVEVASDAAERVIHALNGTTLRGRSLRVDYDRRGSAPPQRSRGTARPHRS
jgi:ATP-dependent RNA helicase DeaD